MFLFFAQALPYIGMAGILFYLIYILYKRNQFKNRSGAGAFFFENDCLVLNTGIPYPIPFHEIERVELHYNQWELDHLLSYSLWIKVIKKNGKTKRVYYKGYKTAKLALPSDMERALKEKGLPCDMIDSRKKN